MASLLDSLNTQLSPELIDRTASALGESPGAISKGMSAVLPALLVAVADKAKDPGTLQQLYQLVTDDVSSDLRQRDMSSLLGTLTQGTGPLATVVGKLLSFLFGSRSDSLASAVANHAGIKTSSASSLIRLGAPLVLSLLGDRVQQDGLGAPALAALLGGQRDSLARSIPGPLAALVGGRAAAPRAPEARPVSRSHEPERSSGLRWLLPLAIGLGVLAVLWGLLSGDRDERTVALAPEPTVAKPMPAVSAPPPTAALRRYSLPNGVEISFPQAGLETELVDYLTDSSRTLADDSWFNFDRLLFETDSAALKPQSREQLAAVAEILKAYPSVRVKIGGYTDNTGDSAHNLELSRARANSVRDELVRLGIASDRLAAEGYGQDHPVASNETETGRAQNRRIAVLVTSR